MDDKLKQELPKSLYKNKKLRAIFYYLDGKYKFDISLYGLYPDGASKLKSIPVESDSIQMNKKCKQVIRELEQNHPGKPKHVPKGFWKEVDLSIDTRPE